MKPWFALGLFSVLVWGGLVFVAQIATGWIHVPLVIGVLLLVRGIVETGPTRSPSSKT